MTRNEAIRMFWGKLFDVINSPQTTIGDFFEAEGKLREIYDQLNTTVPEDLREEVWNSHLSDIK